MPEHSLARDTSKELREEGDSREAAIIIILHTEIKILIIKFVALLLLAADSCSASVLSQLLKKAKLRNFAYNVVSL